MSAPKFTPGPWVVEGPHSVVGGGQCLEIRGYAITVATLAANDAKGSADEKATRADANLIAAAPDLYAELEKSAALLNALLGAMPPALQKKWPNIVKRALESTATSDAALAKARGDHD